MISLWELELEGQVVPTNSRLVDAHIRNSRHWILREQLCILALLNSAFLIGALLLDRFLIVCKPWRIRIVHFQPLRPKSFKFFDLLVWRHRSFQLFALVEFMRLQVIAHDQRCSVLD